MLLDLMGPGAGAEFGIMIVLFIIVLVTVVILIAWFILRGIRKGVEKTDD